MMSCLVHFSRGTGSAWGPTIERQYDEYRSHVFSKDNDYVKIRGVFKSPCARDEKLNGVQVEECLEDESTGANSAWLAKKEASKDLVLKELAKNESINATFLDSACASVHTSLEAQDECLSWIRNGLEGPLTAACTGGATYGKCKMMERKWSDLQNLVRRQIIDGRHAGNITAAIAVARAELVKKARDEAAASDRNDKAADEFGPKFEKMLKDEKEYTANGTKMLNDMTAELTKYTSKGALNVTSLIGNKLNLPEIDFEKGLEKGLEEARKDPNLPSNSANGMDASAWTHSWKMKPHLTVPGLKSTNPSSQSLASTRERQRLLMTSAYTRPPEAVEAAADTELDFKGLINFLEKGSPEPGQALAAVKPARLMSLASAGSEEDLAKTGGGGLSGRKQVNVGGKAHRESLGKDIHLLHKIIKYAEVMSKPDSSDAHTQATASAKEVSVHLRLHLTCGANFCFLRAASCANPPSAATPQLLPTALGGMHFLADSDGFLLFPSLQVASNLRQALGKAQAVVAEEKSRVKKAKTEEDVIKADIGDKAKFSARDMEMTKLEADANKVKDGVDKAQKEVGEAESEQKRQVRELTRRIKVEDADVYKAEKIAREVKLALSKDTAVVHRDEMLKAKVMEEQLADAHREKLRKEAELFANVENVAIKANKALANAEKVVASHRAHTKEEAQLFGDVYRAAVGVNQRMRQVQLEEKEDQRREQALKAVEATSKSASSDAEKAEELVKKDREERLKHVESEARLFARVEAMATKVVAEEKHAKTLEDDKADENEVSNSKPAMAVKQQHAHRQAREINVSGGQMLKGGDSVTSEIQRVLQESKREDEHQMPDDSVSSEISHVLKQSEKDEDSFLSNDPQAKEVREERSRDKVEARSKAEKQAIAETEKKERAETQANEAQKKADKVEKEAALFGHVERLAARTVKGLAGANRLVADRRKHLEEEAGLFEGVEAAAVKDNKLMREAKEAADEQKKRKERKEQEQEREREREREREEKKVTKVEKEREKENEVKKEMREKEDQEKKVIAERDRGAHAQAETDEVGESVGDAGSTGMHEKVPEVAEPAEVVSHSKATVSDMVSRDSSSDDDSSDSGEDTSLGGNLGGLLTYLNKPSQEAKPPPPPKKHETYAEKMQALIKDAEGYHVGETVDPNQAVADDPAVKDGEGSWDTEKMPDMPDVTGVDLSFMHPGETAQQRAARKRAKVHKVRKETNSALEKVMAIDKKYSETQNNIKKLHAKYKIDAKRAAEAQAKVEKMDRDGGNSMASLIGILGSMGSAGNSLLGGIVGGAVPKVAAPAVAPKTIHANHKA